MQELAAAWQNGLLYSKFMVVSWIVLPFLALAIARLLEENHL